MRTTVSAGWQTVIPQKIREALRIQPNSQLEWEVKEGYVVVHPIPPDSIRAALGFFRDLDSPNRPSLTEELLAERRRDCEKEKEVEREPRS